MAKAKTKSCRACASVISTRAKICPECGSYNKPKSSFGGSIFTILAAALAAIFGYEKLSDSAAAKPETPARMTIGVGHAVSIDGLHVTIESVSQSRRIGSLPAPEGATFIITKISIENASPYSIIQIKPHRYELRNLYGLAIAPDREATALFALRHGLDLRPWPPHALGSGERKYTAAIFIAEASSFRSPGWRLKIDSGLGEGVHVSVN